jgi:hypothetical protein
MDPAERAERSEAINQIVAASDVARWIRYQLEDIRSLTPPLRGLSNQQDAQPNGSPSAQPTKDVHEAGMER